jgi:glycosyltransferase involved in cell wall biosynthesis
VSTALRACSPEVIVCGGYNYFALWQAQRWALRRGVRFLLWSESNALDARRNFPWVEAAKRRFIRSCHGYVVPGASAAEYMEAFGVERERIFVASNAVDVERFSNGAEQARRDFGLRQRLGLPQRYLLYVGRFVRAKGVLDLLAAYATLPEGIRREVGLVLAGDGEEREELVRRSRKISPGEVLFPGFLQRDELSAFYALAEALVFPTHSDPWGLVVNEAMACGLPVIVTDVAGCVAGLVRDGENGYVVGAGDAEALSQAMGRLLSTPDLQKQMGQSSREISSRFTPQGWAEGLVRATAGNSGEARG